MANTIQIRRGLVASIPAGAAGEPLFATDEGEEKLYISNGTAAKGVIMDMLLDANSVLIAVANDTPVALALAASTMLGRASARNIVALAKSDILTIINVTELATPTNFTNVNAALAAANADIDVNSQKITNLVDPIAAQGAATKAYVDSVAQGLSPIADCVAMTTEELPACVYDNGVDGVGATLTGDENGALAAQDGVTLEQNERLLVKNNSVALENGVYKLTTVGDGETKFVLTRVTDMDEDDEIAHVFIFITEGTTGADTGWVCTNEPEAVTVGTDAITFSQFSAAGHITPGTGLAKSGNTLSVDGGLLSIDGLTYVSASFIKMTNTDTYAIRTLAETKEDLSLDNVTNIKNKLDATEAPGVTNDIDEGYTVGSNWYDITNDKAYVCLDNTDSAAVWIDTTAANAVTFVGLSDTPANYTDAGLKIVRVNDGAGALEFVAFAATYLEASPSDGEANKAPDSNWAFDHNAAATAVHGAAENTLLHSGSTIDGGSFA